MPKWQLNYSIGFKAEGTYLGQAIFLVSIAIGIVIGMYVTLSDKRKAVLQILEKCCVLLLLFIMGLSVGSYRDILKNITTLGLKAALFAIVTILFSVILVYVVTKIFLKEKPEQ